MPPLRGSVTRGSCSIPPGLTALVCSSGTGGPNTHFTSWQQRGHSGMGRIGRVFKANSEEVLGREV